MKSVLFTLCCVFCATIVSADSWTDPNTKYTWRYVVENGKAIVGEGGSILTTSSQSFTIPQKIAGFDVVGINAWAFAGGDYKSLGSISIPYGIKTIGDAAFSAPSDLREIILPDSVTDMGKSVFWGCYYLSSIKLSENLNTIGDFVFEGCRALSTITIPSSVATIGEQAFYNCSNLKTVVFAENSTLTFIGKKAFDSCKMLEQVIIPVSVTSIDEKAFASCSALKQLVIPSGVTTIGKGAFDSCTALTAVSLPESLAISSLASVFSNCENIQTIYSYGAPFTLDLKKMPKELYYSSKYAEEWETYLASLSPLDRPDSVICMGHKVTVIPVVSGGGVTTFQKKIIMWGDTVTIEATPNEGFLFLGWSSNIEGIEGLEPTLTFTMPEEPVTLVANFFPKALVKGWIDAAVEAKIDGTTLLTPEQADKRTEAVIEEKVSSGELLTQEGAAAKTEEIINEKVEKKELITSDQLKEMALGVPLIEVMDGKAQVGISLKRATALDGGAWEQVVLEKDAATVRSDGALNVSVPAGEKAAFYKFVVPTKQNATAQKSMP